MPAARSTGAPILHDGRLYAARRGRVRRKRGSITSIRVLHVPRQPFGVGCRSHGEVIWKAGTDYRGSKAARQEHDRGPALGSGRRAGVWSAPTIDTKRGSIYVATGNGYSDPPH